MLMGKKITAGMTALVMVLMMTAGTMLTDSAYAAEKAGTLPVDDDVQAIVSGMSTRQKITQCLMMDFRKWNDETDTARDMTRLTDEVRELIADHQFGSIILFAENMKKTDETVELVRDMQEAVMSKGGQPMIIATDQEGGIVYRLGSGTALPGNMALAATGDPANAEAAGGIIGSEMDAVGINTTLAPVLDVNNNPGNPVIGLRSFGDVPDTVGQYGSRYIAGLNKYNIIGCGKHFPGHGDTATDSHYGLPSVDKSLEQLMECELKPFQIAIDQKIDMIMTAHILYPQVDETKILSEKTGKEESKPATMSKKILTDILRGTMKYDGVVVTDALNMKGIADNFNMDQATVESIRAGADLICMPLSDEPDRDAWITKMESILNKAEHEAETDAEFAARLDEAAARVLTLKKKKRILDYDASRYTVERAKAVVGCAENRALEREITAKAVTVVKNENGTLPCRLTEDSKVLMLAPYDNEKASMVIGFNRAKEAGIVPKNAKVWVHRYSSDSYQIDDEIDTELEKALDWADVVVINSEIYGAARLAYNHWTSEAPKMYTDYCRKNGKKSIVMSIAAPYDVQLYPNADAVIAVYGWKGSSIIGMPQLIYGETTGDADAFGPNISAGVEVAFGEYGASGKLPIAIPVFDPEKMAYSDETAYERGYGLTYSKISPVKPIGKAAIKTLKAGKKKLTVKMTTAPSKKNGTKYQIAYKVKGATKWNYKTTTKASLTIKGLKKGKKYVVKARAIRSGSSYGAWSSTRTSGKIK